MPKPLGRMGLINLLFWFGLCLNIAGVAASLTAGQWSAVTLGLMIAGCFCLGLWLLGRWRLSTRQVGSWWRGRSFQAGTNALLSTLALMIILGLANLLAARYSVQVDLTENKVFSLAPQTVEVVKKLEKPLEILVFDDNPPPQHRTLLEQYQRLNPDRFTFKFVDPQKEVGLIEKYDIRNAGAVVMMFGDRTKTSQLEFKEVNLTPEIVSLVGEQPKVYFLQGQGELPIAGDQENLSEAVAALQREGFGTELLSLVEKKEVPADAKVLVIASPQRRYGAAEVKLLEAYLAQGGHILLMLDPDTNHGLEAFLQSWGVKLDNRLVLDATRQLVGLGPAVPLVVDYEAHPITEDFKLVSFFPKAQALTVDPDRPQQETIEFLRTGQNSWAEADPENEQLEFDADRDSQGPLTIGVAMRRPVAKTTPTKSPESTQDQQPSSRSDVSSTPDPGASPTPPAESPTEKAQPSPAPNSLEPNPGETTNEPARQPKTTKEQDKEPSQPEARMVVIGDADFSISGFFSDPRVANGDVFLNSVAWLSNDSDQPTLSIRPKENTNRKLTLEVQRQQQLALLGILLPLGALAVAVALWWQRR